MRSREITVKERGFISLEFFNVKGVVFFYMV